MSFTSGSVAWKDDFYNTETLKKQSWDKLRKLCTADKNCKKHFTRTCKTLIMRRTKAGCKEETKPVLIEALMRGFNIASGDHPFGTCSKDDHCHRAAKASPNHRDLKAHMSK